MKGFLLFLTTFMMFLFYACKKDLVGSGNIITENRLPGNFNAIKSEGDFQVFVIKDGSTSVDLIGEDNVLNKIDTKVQNGQLTIEYGPGVHSHRHKQVIINVRTPNVDEVQLNGSGSIYSPDIWTGPYFWIELNGSGDAGFKVNADEVTVNVNGSGSVAVSGSAEAGSLVVRGSGSIKAFPLEISEANADKEGSGKIEVFAKDKLEAKLKGSGNIYYKGNPQLKVEISGSGKVVKSN